MRKGVAVAELLIKECRVSSLFPNFCEGRVYVYTLLRVDDQSLRAFIRPSNLTM